MGRGHDEIRTSKSEARGDAMPISQAGIPLDYADIRKLFDREEIQQRKERSRGQRGRTLDQIIDSLRSMG